MSAPAASLGHQVADTIRGKILRGEIPIGSWLRQEALAEEFGVSRMPVREAIRSLDAAGVVELVPHRGALVRGPTVTEILDSYQVRAELEALAAELAARAVRPASPQLAELEHAERLFDEAGRRFAALERGERVAERARDRWERANDALHSGIHRASGNVKLIDLVKNLNLSLPRSLSGSPLVEEPRLMSQNIAEHAAIVQAIRERDPQAARRAMHEHVIGAGDLVARWYSDRNAETLAPQARSDTRRIVRGSAARPRPVTPRAR